MHLNHVFGLGFAITISAILASLLFSDLLGYNLIQKTATEQYMNSSILDAMEAGK